MSRLTPVARLTAFVLLLAGLVGTQSQAGELTVIKLNRQATVQHDTVVLGDVAHVSGPSSTTVKRLQALDLTVLESTGDSEAISARHVQARLLLEGIDPRTVNITGPAESTVTLVSPEATAPASPLMNYQDDVLSQAVEALAKSWLAAPEDVEVQILASQTGMESHAGSMALPELELPARLEPGRIQARLKWMSQGKIERVEQFTLEARLRQTVLLATHNINRGVPLKPQDVVEDRRLLSTRVEQIRAEQVVGCVAKRGLTQGDQLAAKDLTVPKVMPAIQARNGVRVVAKKGRLTVTLQMAEALEAGNVGDVIRLRNLDSGRIITGRVVSSQEVEIPLN